MPSLSARLRRTAAAAPLILTALVGNAAAQPGPAPSAPAPDPRIEALVNAQKALEKRLEEEALARKEAEAKLHELELAGTAQKRDVDALLKAEEARRKEAELKAREDAGQKAEAQRLIAEKRVPFADADYTWMNGQSKQKDFPFTFSPYVTPSLYFDGYYAYSLNQPKDNTLTGTASTGRHNEFTINLLSIGFDWSYKNVIGRITLQWGAMLDIVQSLDGTTARGHSLSIEALKHIREATAGYHFDVMYGVNMEMGLFMSYIGLESYLLAENWNYNRSLICEFTPFYFTGVRAQIFPSKNVKIEPWLMNGYQSYGKWNEAPSAGLSLRWHPREWLGLVANFYAGTDTKNDPGRVRFHHDHSVLARLYDNKDGALSKVAFSLNNHAGFEQGGAVSDSRKAYLVGTSAALRAWFAKDRLALTGRFEALRHAGGYSAQFPPPGFVAGDDFTIAGVTGTVEIMPMDLFSIRPEIVYRTASVPFFAGPGGTTSPDGFQGTPGPFTPDVRKDQVLVMLGANFRL
jgi:Putative beta-barrel porin-2, OmpL-like. bbp2